MRWELSRAPGPARQYLEGHIPGAAFVDLETALAGPPGAAGVIRCPRPTRSATAMRLAGVSGDRPVVVYDAGDSMAAARAWWLLRYFGHPEVFVLDGGFVAGWPLGYAVEREVPVVEPGDFVPRRRRDAAAGRRRRGARWPAPACCSTRGAGALPRRAEPIDPVAGHIPGRSTCRATRTSAGGRWRVPGRRGPAGSGSQAAGVRDGVEVGAYCGSGVAAAQEVLALEAAGFAGALYVGSWSDWIRNPRRGATGT